ncbi:MAG: alpha/beta fold hydrolase [Alphaproteobacteria bacterium]|nr:alpha/beta fold hydrolase [Alphaproteobacteria bacterium]
MTQAYTKIEETNPTDDKFNGITVVILHGVDGFPEKSWYGWLARQLQAKGCRTFVPQLPTKVPADGIRDMYDGNTPEKLGSYDYQTLNEWTGGVEACLKGLDPEKTIVIGHSLGGAMAVHTAHQMALEEKKLLGLFCVCPVAGDINLLECEPGLSTFYKPMTPEFVKKAQQGVNGRNRWVIVSNNDQDVPPEQSRPMAEALGASIFCIPGAKHINRDSGFTPDTGFPFLLEKVSALIEQNLNAQHTVKEHRSTRRAGAKPEELKL